MRGVVNYVIIWNPPGSTFSPTYQALIERYFTDVGGTPFMNIITQYGDTSGAPVPNTCAFGGTWVDTGNAYPHAGTATDPLLDSDIQAEVDRAIAANPAWQGPGLSTMYFVFLGHHIIECSSPGGDCFAGTDINGNTPATAKFCAYHSSFGSPSRIYATMPYAADGNCKCASPYPNGVDQDVVLSTTSHEQFEAYTDPFGDAWYDGDLSHEIGDECAYDYGQVEPDGTSLVLNGHRYQLQREWSDFLPGGCLKRVGPASQPTITPGSLDFGTVPRGTTASLNVLIQDTAAGELNLLNVRLGGGPSAFSIDPTSPLWGTLPFGDNVTIRVNFSPSASASSAGPLFGQLVVDTDELGYESQFFQISGTVGLPKASITGSTQFGNVCAGARAQSTVWVCNSGNADLHVSSIAFSPDCHDFTLVNNPFPATVSPDSCLNQTILFTPTSCGAKSCTLVIHTDDPNNPTINLTVTANTPCPSIDVAQDVCFLPEVIQSVGSCLEPLPFPISNKGTCNLTVSNITISGSNPGDFSLLGLPSFPIILQPGELVGDGNLNVVFAPTVVARSRTATITVTYVLDPIAGTTASITRNLSGEGVRTGARVLVTSGGVPVPSVEKIQLQRINGNRNKNLLDTQDVVQNAALTNATPTLPCQPFQYHREYGTVSNPIQLLPGSYQVTASVVINGKRSSQTVGFNVNTCDFNPNIVIGF
jgi:hypothetical protein